MIDRRPRTLEFAALILLLCASVIWAGYQPGTEEILYQRLDGIGMSVDSINMVMALPRSLITDWDSNGVGCATYLDVADAVAAAAIVVVKGDCFEKRVLFNYVHLIRKGER